MEARPIWPPRPEWPGTLDRLAAEDHLRQLLRAARLAAKLGFHRCRHRRHPKACRRTSGSQPRADWRRNPADGRTPLPAVAGKFILELGLEAPVFMAALPDQGPRTWGVMKLLPASTSATPAALRQHGVRGHTWAPTRGCMPINAYSRLAASLPAGQRRPRPVAVAPPTLPVLEREWPGMVVSAAKTAGCRSGFGDVLHPVGRQGRGLQRPSRPGWLS